MAERPPYNVINDVPQTLDATFIEKPQTWVVIGLLVGILGVVSWFIWSKKRENGMY